MLPSLGKRLCCLIFLTLLTMALLGCFVGEAVRKVAEPIDNRGCKWDCARADMEFGHYVYETNACWCQSDTGEVKLYETIHLGGER